MAGSDRCPGICHDVVPECFRLRWIRVDSPCGKIIPVSWKNRIFALFIIGFAGMVCLGRAAAAWPESGKERIDNHRTTNNRYEKTLFDLHGGLDVVVHAESRAGL